MTPTSRNLKFFSQFHSSGKRDDDMGKHWEEDYLELKEWNDREHRRKGEFHGEWKKYFGVWRL
jgi:hypothetical protein